MVLSLLDPDANFLAPAFIHVAAIQEDPNFAYRPFVGLLKSEDAQIAFAAAQILVLQISHTDTKPNYHVQLCNWIASQDQKSDGPTPEAVFQIMQTLLEVPQYREPFYGDSQMMNMLNKTTKKTGNSPLLQLRILSIFALSTEIDSIALDLTKSHDLMPSLLDMTVNASDEAVVFAAVSVLKNIVNVASDDVDAPKIKESFEHIGRIMKDRAPIRTNIRISFSGTPNTVHVLQARRDLEVRDWGENVTGMGDCTYCAVGVDDQTTPIGATNSHTLLSLPITALQLKSVSVPSYFLLTHLKNALRELILVDASIDPTDTDWAVLGLRAGHLESICVDTTHISADQFVAFMKGVRSAQSQSAHLHTLETFQAQHTTRALLHALSSFTTLTRLVLTYSPDVTVSDVLQLHTALTQANTNFQFVIRNCPVEAKLKKQLAGLVQFMVVDAPVVSVD
ncbi:hypothetical protein HDV00_004243 [Rhizophlyctis rosea]|nr:hypothetical protein HDV00_004243 [Rhizophlyctis rosea]